MNQYLYDGPVMLFDICIEQRWIAMTRANTEKKARSNLAYQYKKAHNKSASSKITLPGELQEVYVKGVRSNGRI